MIALNHNMLDGKIVLLTGAGGGIGFEAAKAFVEMGAKVLIAEVNQEKENKRPLISTDSTTMLLTSFMWT